MVFCLSVCLLSFAFINKEGLMVSVGRTEGASQERVDYFRKKELFHGGRSWRR